MATRFSASRYTSLIVLAALLTAASCSSHSGSISNTTHEMGERIQAGNLIYTILEVEWLEQISRAVPKNSNSKFAVVRLSITNAGNQEVSVPMLQLLDDKGNGAMELAEIEGVEEWLGVLRNVGPAETIQGRIVFEVTPKNYRLRVTDAAEPDRERFAMVNIPLRLDQKPPVALEAPGQQQ